MPSERKRPSAHAPKPATSGTKTLPEKIADFVLTHRGHFALALVRCNSARQRDGMLGVLRDQLFREGVQLEILQLELHKVDDLLAWIRTATSGPQPAKADAFAITGLEGSLPSEGAPWTFAARLNLQRDAIAAEFGGPILVWLTDYAMDLFMRVAPDLADYARLVLRVREPEVGALEEWATPRGIPVQSSQKAASPFSNQGLDALHDRISELQREGANASRAELLDLASLLSLAASRFEGTRDRRTGLPYLEQAGTIYRQLGIAEEQADVSRRAGRILHDAGDYLSAIQAFERALERVRKTGSRKGEAAILGDLGNCHRAIAALPKAIEYHEAALRIHREIGLRDGEANALGNLGNCHFTLGNLAKAIESHEAAVRIHREIGLRDGETNALGNLGICYATLGDLARAIELHEAALQIAREIGSREEEASNLGNLGVCYGILRDLARAIELHEAALRIHREIGSREGEANDLANLGSCYGILGEFSKALEHHVAALRIHREIGFREGEAKDLGNIGNRYQSIGQIQKAIEQYEAALRLFRDIGHRQGEANALGNLGSCYRRLGDLTKALQSHEAALRIHREIGFREGEASDLGNLGACYQDQGDMSNALKHHAAALQIHHDVGSREGEATQLVNIGRILNQGGNYEGALAFWLLAQAIFDELGSPTGKKVGEWIRQLESAIGSRPEWKDGLDRARRGPQWVVHSLLGSLV